MGTTETISVSMPAVLLRETRELAQKENRTVDELVGEAIQRYREDRQWEELLAFGRQSAAAAGVSSEQDVVKVIHDFRREQRKLER